MNRIIMIQFIYIFLIILSAPIIQAEDITSEQLVQAARSEVNSISINDLKKMIDDKEDLIILDIRDKEEFLKSHIQGARHISRGLLEFMVTDKIPDKNARIVVY